MAHNQNRTIENRATAALAMAVCIGVLFWIAWQLAHVLLTVFAGVIAAVILRSASEALTTRLHVPQKLGVPLAVLLVVVLLWILFGLGGDQLAAQIADMRDQVPKAVNSLTDWLGQSLAGRTVLDFWTGLEPGDVPWRRVAIAAFGTVGFVGVLIFVAFIGIYLAMDPAVYRRGFLFLMPTSYRERIDKALAESGDALSRWLLGQSVSMLFVGAATTIGLFSLGAPLAVSLGVIAGLLTFIPFFGPLAAGALAVTVAFSQGPMQALYVAILAISVQQLEGHLLTPIVQRWAVALPPALAIVSGVAFGALFGVIGLAVATPLTVVGMVWVRNLLGDRQESTTSR